MNVIELVDRPEKQLNGVIPIDTGEIRVDTNHMPIDTEDTQTDTRQIQDDARDMRVDTVQIGVDIDETPTDRNEGSAVFIKLPIHDTKIHKHFVMSSLTQASDTGLPSVE